MKRPMFVIGVSFSVAMWVAFYFALTLHHNLYVAASLSLLAVLCHFTLKTKHCRTLAILLFAAGIAFGAYYSYSAQYIEPFAAITKETLYVNGMITEAKPSSGQATRYTITVNFPQDNLPPAIVYAYQFGEVEFGAGDIISGELKPFPPRSPLVAQNMRRAGVVLSASLINTSQRAHPEFEFAQKLLLLREQLCANLFRVMPQHIAEFEQGVIFGLISEIPEDVYSSMQRSGTLHLLAVSGYHLTVLAGVAIFVLRRTRLPVKLQYFIAWLFCFGFVLLTGFSPSLLRSLIMISVVMCARIISRRADTLNSLGLSLLLICIIRPSWVLGFGLWYSVLSCMGIAILTEPSTTHLTRFLRVKGRFAHISIDAFSVSFAAYIFTLPLTFIQNGWIPVFSPLANLFVTPFVPLTLIGGMLCAVLPVTAVSSFIATAVSVGVSMTTGISRTFASLPFAIIAFDKLWTLLLFVGLICGMLLLYRRKADFIRYLTLFCTVAAVLSCGLLAEAAYMQNRAELVLIGEENLPIIIRGKSAVLLAVPNQYNIDTVIRYLDFRGINEIDALIAADNNGRLTSGITRLYDNFPIHCAIAPADEHTLNLLSQAMPGVAIYPSNYAKIDMLGGITCSFDELGGVALQIGRMRAFSYRGEYDTILDNINNDAIFIYTDTVLLPAGILPAAQPIGGSIFDESRILLKLEE